MKMKQILATAVATGVLTVGLGATAGYAVTDAPGTPDRMVNQKAKVCKRLDDLKKANSALLVNIDGRIKIIEDLKDGSSEKMVKRMDGQIRRLQERKNRHTDRLEKLAKKCAEAPARSKDQAATGS